MRSQRAFYSTCPVVLYLGKLELFQGGGEMREAIVQSNLLGAANEYFFIRAPCCPAWQSCLLLGRLQQVLLH